MRLCQRTVGQGWIHHCTKHLRHVYGMDRLPTFEPGKSYVIVSNHRSFFDLYVITSHLVRSGLTHRIVFPVRSAFFYTSPVGLFVNGVMSFFAMYPPLFRDRQRAPLNRLCLEELAGLLRAGETLVGIHPEGRRNPGSDPYDLLPAKSGVGRLICAAPEIPVIPVFINGLLPNDLPRQVRSNFDGSGIPIHSVFGAPIDFGDLLSEAPSPRLFSRVAQHCLDEVRLLGEEERRLRAAEDPGSQSSS
jgi:1-acyl-sn-glycerol-3-phosphate acyltransferase